MQSVKILGKNKYKNVFCFKIMNTKIAEKVNFNFEIHQVYLFFPLLSQDLQEKFFE